MKYSKKPINQNELLGFGKGSKKKTYYGKYKDSVLKLRLFRELLDQTSDGIILIDFETRNIIDLNISARKLLQITEENSSSKNLPELLNTSTEITSFFEEHQNEASIVFSQTQGKKLLIELQLKVATFENEKYIVGIVRDITARVQMEKSLLANLHEKEILMKEIHHRVKNNFQIINSLLSIQQHSKNNSSTQFIEETQARIMSMALIHEKLYSSERLDSINLQNYFSDLIDYLQDQFYDYSKKVYLSLDIEAIHVSLDMAVPLGLITSECVTNSFKHAFSNIDHGLIKITAKAHNETLKFIVQDNGIGIDKSIFHQPSEESLGTTLITSLTQQLQGTLKVEESPGTQLIFSIPILN